MGDAETPKLAQDVLGREIDQQMQVVRHDHVGSQCCPIALQGELDLMHDCSSEVIASEQRQPLGDGARDVVAAFAFVEIAPFHAAGLDARHPFSFRTATSPGVSGFRACAGVAMAAESARLLTAFTEH